MLKNEGWTYYEYPDLGFSVELPNQSYFNTQYTDNPTDRYVWSIYSYKTDDTKFNPEVFYNFSNRIVIPVFSFLFSNFINLNNIILLYAFFFFI